MVHQQLKRQNSGLPRMESISRFGSIPVVETGLKTAGTVYQKVKTSNGLFNWGFETAETVTYALVDSLRPAAKLIEGPLHQLDSFMCKSLDFVEQKVPSMYLPPEMLNKINKGLSSPLEPCSKAVLMTRHSTYISASIALRTTSRSQKLMYWNTKEYMSDHLVKPVLSRANSMKNLSHAVLDSRVSNYAADRLDGALNVCDKYVERFLPAEDQPDAAAVPQPEPDEAGVMHVFQTIHRGQRISRKLRRRLTFRTRQELSALKKQSTEAVHVVFYAAELIATNPRLAMQKTVELWQYLSADEPENQARPNTFEQLAVLLARESVRKVVHMINFTASTVTKIPQTVRAQTRELVHHLLFATDRLIKAIHLEKAKNVTVSEATGLMHKLQNTYDELQNQTNLALQFFCPAAWKPRRSPPAATTPGDGSRTEQTIIHSIIASMAFISVRTAELLQQSLSEARWVRLNGNEPR
ncbi:lipid storage droplets surface-binding protein 1 isoform X3 [Culex pipiens pallens]|uniref:lipid storage droplets surface-binding protein 1 isoform X3 n=1 Tax=Culex pipiens pallens TaxID=42434 RepID=UPI0022A9FDF0|nr:lipid storage droplets surface-binding protein 1 isoform X3 [Culex pipiens pallens]